MAAMNQSQREDIFNAVKSMYTDIVSCPGKTCHFPSGRSACEYPGYPAEQLDTLPEAQSVPDLCVDDVAGRGVGDVGRPANGAYRLDGYDKDLQPVGVYRCTGGGKPGGSEVGLEMRTKKQTKPTPKHPKNGPPGNAKSLIYCRRGRDYSGLRPSPLRGRRHSRRSARPAVACRTA